MNRCSALHHMVLNLHDYSSSKNVVLKTCEVLVKLTANQVDRYFNTFVGYSMYM